MIMLYMSCLIAKQRQHIDNNIDIMLTLYVGQLYFMLVHLGRWPNMKSTVRLLVWLA